MKLVDHEGNVAATMGWARDWAEPVDTKTLRVSDILVQEYARHIGLEIRDIRGDVGMIWPLGAVRPIRVDMSEWEQITISRPVKKPRKGKKQGSHYDWEWVRGKWQRVWLD